ncbi:MAG: glycosyl hydrolase [Balneola sp.]|nr:glycosyl hydrolase [Balneola sp.]|tara:strand:+ start:91090 stop:93936 length:2847 start_codon:yes stop_codon:yes gene_type:complete
MFKKLPYILTGLLFILVGTSVQTNAQQSEGCFDIISDGNAVPLYISQDDWDGAQRAMGDLQTDLRNVSQNTVHMQSTGIPHGPRFVMAGTIGKSPEIDALIESGKLDVSEIEGEWEAYQIQVVENPFEGIEEALVIAGSDKRGTIFGIYEISNQIGVSPWYWWADVPIEQKDNVSVLAGCKLVDMPKVQYRGIFLNDENPALYGWVHETYGGFNHEFYGDVFELLLRQKANYIWTAMWGKAFYDDDPLNAQTADKYGVVIGTSHHEPMARAHVEWERYGEGDWNYQTNEETLKEFWRTGIERLKDYEASISLAMRGDGDEAMSEETNVELLQRIVKDQREIIDEISPENKDRQVQLWALYKEVQDYYEQGMRVPEEVMLLAADDNWGNVRLMPRPGSEAQEHEAGWGLYYHFDYVGGPRNYKWLNTNQISRTWEQMNLVWEHKMDRMWLVNVGDLKPMEFPISFFLDHAWDPEEMTIDKMESYPAEWASYQFGEEYGEQVGNMLSEYTKYNARRKHELLSPETYSLFNFNEAERVVKDYNDLAKRADALYEKLPQEYKDAFYQLVLFPVKASANLNELYVTTAKNRWYAEQGRAKTNEMAKGVQYLFDKDSLLTEEYHTDLADGKWNHFMSQTHIGYTYWQQPPYNNIPETDTIELPDGAEMGVSVQGSSEWWPNSGAQAKLPAFDNLNQQDYYLEVFNRGAENFRYTAEPNSAWLKVKGMTGEVDDQERLWVYVDWEQVPEGTHTGTITIESEDGEKVDVQARATHHGDPQNISGFVEANGFVSIEPANYHRTVGADNAKWVEVPRLGRTGSSITPHPVTASPKDPGSENSPRLEYDLHLFTEGEVKVKVYLAPTLNYYMDHPGLRYGISINDEEPQVVNIHDDFNWNQVVADYANVKSTTHTISETGQHTLKIWMQDAGVVIQKIVIETGDVGETYLGPPESYRSE